MPLPRVFAYLPLVVLLLWPIPGRAVDPALVDALRAGGYILYFRHAATDWSQADRNRDADWDSCDPAQMRQLSDAGREVAKQVGDALRRLRIPVGQVVASDFCRARETARLLGLGPVETTSDLINTTHAEHVGGREALRRRVQRRMSIPPPPGTNTVLVAHGNVFMLVSEPRPVEAGTAIVRPNGNGGFELIAAVTPDEWIEFARTQSSGGKRP